MFPVSYNLCFIIKNGTSIDFAAADFEFSLCLCVRECMRARARAYV